MLTVDILLSPKSIEVQESGVREVQLLIEDNDLSYILPLNESHVEMLLEALDILEEDL